MSYENDIPVGAARAAHEGTSMVPEQRAEQIRSEYARRMAADFEALSRVAGDDEGKRATLAEEFARYRAGYRGRYLAYLGARSRCLSALVTGPSNFPTERNAKRNGTADRLLLGLEDFRERALKAIRRTLRPELAPVMAGDADATERLLAKIEKLERRQEVMKAANAAIRKHKREGAAAQVAALVGLGFSEFMAGKLLEPDYAGRVGIPSYELTNNNANVRRMKARLMGIERDKATPETESQGTAARLEDCPADNRVRLYFPGKPGADVRTTLKRGGFRWSPSIGAWQAHRNPGSLELARRVAGVA